MKRLAGYALCIIGLCVLFTTCYYISFKNALNRFNESAVERDSQLLHSFTEYQRQNEILNEQASQNPTDTQSGLNVEVNRIEEIRITSNTKYILQIYDIKKNVMTVEELNPTSELVGLTRNEVIDLLASYMEKLPISEKNKGLVSYELLVFTNKELVIRKSYNEDIVVFRYYVAVKEGKVIVYYSDMSTVYENTNIEVINLLEKDRNALMKGIYVKDDEELFSLLESYSS